MPGTTEKYQLLFCFTVLSKVLYCRIKNAFLIVFFMYFHKPMVLSRVRLFVNPWPIARQVPLPMEFPRQEYWSGLPFPIPWDLPNPS